MTQALPKRLAFYIDVRDSSGVTIAQVMSEYRALRTSVLVLWMSSDATSKEHEISDICRFNEAIDQALAESVVCYADAVDAARNVFLGILCHDLRSPLGAILRSEEHTSELQSLMRISYAVFC